MKNLILLFFCFFFSVSILQAQAPEYSSDFGKLKFDLSTHFSSIIPINQLKGNMDTGNGFGITALFGQKNLPIVAGFEYGVYKHHVTRSEIYIEEGDLYHLRKIATKNFSHQGDLIIRIAPKIDFPVIPYIDVSYGFNRFSTWTSIHKDDESGDYEWLESEDSDLGEELIVNAIAIGLSAITPKSRNKETGYWTQAYGVGAGLRIVLVQQQVAWPRTVLNMRVSYRKGGVANYLAKKDDYQIIDSTLDAFEGKRSTTDFLKIQFGIAFILN